MRSFTSSLGDRWVRLVARYAVLDWLVVILFMVVASVVQSTQPHHALVNRSDDRQISFPLLPSQVGHYALLFWSTAAPMIVIFVVLLLRAALRHRRHSSAPSSSSSSSRSSSCNLLAAIWHELHQSYLALALALTSTTAATGILKQSVGRPRPNFYALCMWDENTMSCHNSTEHVNEAYRSFPSGHSSSSFAGLVFLTLWLLHLIRRSEEARALAALAASAHRGGGASAPLSMHQVDRELMHLHSRVLRTKTMGGGRASRMWLVYLCFLPVCVCTWIAMTRLVDYWHHFSDVLAGALIGSVFAWFNFHSKFERPSGLDAHEDEEFDEENEMFGLERVGAGVGTGAGAEERNLDHLALLTNGNDGRVSSSHAESTSFSLDVDDS